MLFAALPARQRPAARVGGPSVGPGVLPVVWAPSPVQALAVGTTDKQKAPESLPGASVAARRATGAGVPAPGRTAQ